MSLNNILWGDIYPFIYILYIKKNWRTHFCKTITEYFILIKSRKLSKIYCRYKIIDLILLREVNGVTKTFRKVKYNLIDLYTSQSTHRI